MELSCIGTGYTSWFSDNSNFCYSSNPFTYHGGNWANGTGAGLYNFSYGNGNANNNNTDHCVVIGK